MRDLGRDLDVREAVEQRLQRGLQLREVDARGAIAFERSRLDGSIERESIVIAFSIALSVAIVWPRTLSDAMSDEPDSAGLPAEQRPRAVAVNAPTWIRSPVGAVSAAMAGPQVDRADGARR